MSFFYFYFYLQVLAKLEKFKQGIFGNPEPQSNESGGSSNDEDLSDWTTMKLKFPPEHGKVVCMSGSFLNR